MSATTARLDQIFEGSCPMPLDPELVLYPSEEVFVALYAYAQAWPILRAEIVRLEAHNASLVEENGKLAAERDTLAKRTIRLADRLAAAEDATTRHLADKLAVAHHETMKLIEAARAVVGLPAEVEAARRVCESVDPYHAGSGGRWAYVDGIALDDWRRCRA